jgi:protein KRI1
VLRNETISAFHTAVLDGDEEDLLVPREKTKDEMEREEEDYKEWLQREVGEDLRELVTVEPRLVGEESEIADDFKEEEKDGGEAVETKKKKKKKDKNNKAAEGNADQILQTKAMSKEEADQQFLLEYVVDLLAL